MIGQGDAPSLILFLMKTKKFYVQPKVKVIEIEVQSILVDSGDGTPGAITDPMPGEE